MKFSIIGTGNIAWHFAQMLSNAGHDVLQICGRNQQSAHEIARQVDATAISEVYDLDNENDAIILAVSDDAIHSISLSVPTHFRVIHTSGSVSLSALVQPKTAVIWPVQSLLKNLSASYHSFPFLIEASDQIMEQWIESWMQPISTKIIRANSEQRQQAHLAAVFANNLSNAVYSIAEEILKRNQLPADLLHPIIQSHVQRLMAIPAHELQTGPARRNDQLTVELHLKSLALYPEQLAVYKAISDYIYQTYHGKKL